MRIYSHAERPELRERRGELGDAWPEFMYHDPVANAHWDRQYEEFPDLQLYLLDEDDRYLAESNAVPIPFGPDQLPDDGWDAAREQAFVGRQPVAVSAIAITIGVDQRGRGLSKTMLDGMRKAVAARGLADLVSVHAVNDDLCRARQCSTPFLDARRVATQRAANHVDGGKERGRLAHVDDERGHAGLKGLPECCGGDARVHGALLER